jgi:hypothetical protein
MSCCLVVMNRGLGDALQQVPAVRALAMRGPFDSLDVLVPSAIIASRCLDGLHVRSITAENDQPALRSRYNWVIDLAGLSWSSELVQEVLYDHHASHDFCTLPTGNGRQNSVFIDGAKLNARFPDMSGLGWGPDADWPAWTMAAQVVAPILGECVTEWVDRAHSCWRDFWGAPVSEGAPKSAKELCSSAILLPCGAAEKHCPPNVWASVFEWMSARGVRARVALGPSEGQSVEASMRSAGYQGSFFRVPLDDLADQIRRSTITIAHDCGPMHLAGAMGARLVAIFGPTNGNCWFPYRQPGSAFVSLGKRKSRYEAPGAHDWGRPGGAVHEALEQSIGV